MNLWRKIVLQRFPVVHQWKCGQMAIWLYDWHDVPLNIVHHNTGRRWSGNQSLINTLHQPKAWIMYKCNNNGHWQCYIIHYKNTSGSVYNRCVCVCRIFVNSVHLFLFISCYDGLTESQVPVMLCSILLEELPGHLLWWTTLELPVIKTLWLCRPLQ